MAEITSVLQTLLTIVRTDMVGYLDCLSKTLNNDPDTAFVVNGRIPPDLLNRLRLCQKAMPGKPLHQEAGGKKANEIHSNAISSLVEYFRLLERCPQEADDFLQGNNGLGMMIFLSDLQRGVCSFRRTVEMDCRGKILREIGEDNQTLITIDCAEIKYSPSKRSVASAQLQVQLRLTHRVLKVLNPSADFRLIGRAFFAKRLSEEMKEKIIPGIPPIRIIFEDGVLSSKVYPRDKQTESVEIAQGTKEEALVTNVLFLTTKISLLKFQDFRSTSFFIHPHSSRGPFFPFLSVFISPIQS
jgi:hypothetical protein